MVKDFKNFKIYENKNSKTIIVVDIQPAYQNYISFNITHFCEFLNDNEDKNILYLYNGAELGYDDDEYSIKEWLMGYGLNYDIYINFFEKTYGFFRELIDDGLTDDVMIEIGKYLLETGNNDISSIDDKFKEKIYNEYNVDIDEYDLFFIPYEIKEFLEDNLYRNEIPSICGGGVSECLYEIELLLRMIDIDFIDINEFIY